MEIHVRLMVMTFLTWVILVTHSDPMTTIARSIEELRVWVLQCGIPRKRLAKNAGLAPSALWAADRSDWSPNAKTILKLEELRARLVKQQAA